MPAARNRPDNRQPLSQGAVWARLGQCSREGGGGVDIPVCFEVGEDVVVVFNGRSIGDGDAMHHGRPRRKPRTSAVKRLAPSSDLCPVQDTERRPCYRDIFEAVCGRFPPAECDRESRHIGLVVGSVGSIRYSPSAVRSSVGRARRRRVQRGEAVKAAVEVSLPRGGLGQGSWL